MYLVITLYVLLLLQHEVYARLTHVNLVSMSSKILEAYPEYELMIHYDNSTFCNLRDFLNSRNSALPKYLYNYDVHDTINLKRPLRNKFVNLVHLINSTRYLPYAKTLFNMEYNDVNIFAMENYAAIVEAKIWELLGLEKAGSLILYDMQKVEFYYVKYFLGNESKILNRIPQGTANLTEYINDFHNFNSHSFSVGYTDYKPYFWCKNVITSPKDNCEACGAEGNVLQVLSKKLNFKYTLRHFSYTTIGPWKAMLHAISAREIDWAVGGITASRARAGFADFSSALLMMNYATLYSVNDAKLFDWSYVLQPFEFPVWCGLVLTITTLALLMKSSFTLLGNKTLKSKSTCYAMIPLQSCFEQSQPRAPQNRITYRVILSIIWIFSIISIAFYKSKLTSTTIKSNTKPPTTLKELLDLNYVFHVNKAEWSVVNESLFDSHDRTYFNVLKRCKDNLYFCEAALETLQGQVAFIEEYAPLRDQLVEKCGHVFTNEQLDSLRLTTENLFANSHAWPMQLAHPFRKRFCKVMQVLKAVGLLNLWYSPESKFKVRKANEVTNTKPVTPIKLYHLLEPALVLVFGYAISSFIFVFEVLMHKYGCN